MEIGRSTLSFNTLRGPQASGVNVHAVMQGDMGAHDHLFHEVVFVIEGAGVHYSAAGRDSLRPGSIIVLRPQVWHAYEQSRSLRIINCLVDSQLITRFGPLLSQVPGTFELYRKRTGQAREEKPTLLHARPLQFRMLTDRLNQIMAELRHKRDGWQASVILAAMDVLVSCARLAMNAPAQGKSFPAENMGRAQQAVLQAVAYIESHYQQHLTLDGLSQRVHLSGAHLSRSFTKYMGMNVISFIHRLRVEEACRLLKATGMPITDIAAAVGYDELAYFSRCFRQQIGLSPRAYRQSGQ